jgi:hypothetical protein
MRESAKKRKNFLPALMIDLFFWVSWLYIFFRISPDSFLPFLAFYLSLFLAVFLIFALILASSRRGLIISAALIGFLLLKQFRLASILNVLLLIASLFSLEIYFSRR